MHKFAMEGKKLIDRHKKTKPDYQKCIQTNKDFERARSEGRCFNGPPPTIMTFQDDKKEIDAVSEWLKDRAARGRPFRPVEESIGPGAGGSG